MSKYTDLLKEATITHKSFRVVERRGTWLGAIFWVLEKLTRTSRSTFHTTIGSTMYVGDNWLQKSDEERYRTLRHELVHVRQFHDWPLGPTFWVLNHIIFSLCYLLLLPARWTFRARFEREAYEETLLAEAEARGGVIPEERMEYNARWLAETFGGPMYFWMWNRKAAYAWAMRTQRAISAGDLLRKTKAS